MMDCSTYKELAGLRSEDLSTDECDGRREHIERCETCRHEQQDDEELLALVDRLPTLESRITAADIWRRDGLEAEAEADGRPTEGETDGRPTVAAVEEDVSPMPQPRRPRSLVPVILAIAAAAALALVLGPRLTVEPVPESGQRFKALTPPGVPASLDLQFSLETAGGGRAMATAGADGALVGADERLLFGVRATGEGDLSVVEIGPDGDLQVVASPEDVAWRVDDAGVSTMVDGSGQTLAYSPDGPAGLYTYEALLTAPRGRLLTSSEARQLLQGDDIPGISLLARDAFTVEWRQDDALPDHP